MYIRGAVASIPVSEPHVMNLGKSRGPQDQNNPEFSRGAIMIPSQEVIRHWVRRSRTTTAIDYYTYRQLVSLMESLIFLPQALAPSESHLGMILACRIKWWVPRSCLLNCINTGSRLQQPYSRAMMIGLLAFAAALSVVQVVNAETHTVSFTNK